MTIIFFSLRPICILSLRVISFYRSVAFHRTVCLSTIEREGKKKQKNEEKKIMTKNIILSNILTKRTAKKLFFFFFFASRTSHNFPEQTTPDDVSTVFHNTKFLFEIVGEQKSLSHLNILFFWKKPYFICFFSFLRS